MQHISRVIVLWVAEISGEEDKCQNRDPAPPLDLVCEWHYSATAHVPSLHSDGQDHGLSMKRTQWNHSTRRTLRCNPFTLVMQQEEQETKHWIGEEKHRHIGNAVWIVFFFLHNEGLFFWYKSVVGVHPY